MNKRIEYTASWTNWVAFCAFFLSFLALNAVASFATAEEFDVSQWQESSERKAGTRMTMKIGKDEYGFVWIPAGEFVMGSPKSEPNRRRSEDQIRVKLTHVGWMFETEVTQKLYKEIMKDNPVANNNRQSQGNFLPVVYISYNEAVQFCEALTKRLPKGLTADLPTEAEWEYACRAGSTTAFSWGDKFDSAKANTSENRTLALTPVKSYPANSWGLYDMHGNAVEWTRDWYVESYAGEYGLGTVVDPEGPEDGDGRVVRGGGFLLEQYCARSAARGRSWPNNRYADIGFRFVIRLQER